jgi:hypothetical protein
LVNGPIYSELNSSTLTITELPLVDNYRYRAKITSGSPSCSRMKLWNLTIGEQWPGTEAGLTVFLQVAQV